MQRKVVKSQDFPDLPTLEKRELAFQDRYNQTAASFDWRYSRKDLNDYLTRLAAHENQAA